MAGMQTHSARAPRSGSRVALRLLRGYFRRPADGSGPTEEADMSERAEDARRPIHNVLERVRAALPGLRKSDAKVAGLVLSDPFRILETSVSEAATLAHVSQPTVIRFCRSLGWILTISGLPPRSFGRGMFSMSDVTVCVLRPAIDIISGRFTKREKLVTSL